MDIDLIITIIIAIVGWVFAFWQMYKNRQWQKRDALAERRYVIYSQFLAKVDEMASQMSNAPQKLMRDIYTEFVREIMQEGADADAATVKFSKKLADYVSDSIKPMWVFKQELSGLKLIASDDLLEIIEAMQGLTEDLYNDYQNCLNRLDAKNLESFKELETIGKDNRMERYTFLYTELSRLMREEIQLK